MIKTACVSMIGPLVAEWPPAGFTAGDKLTLRSPLWVFAERNGEQFDFEVPAGFRTDLASDPLDRHGRQDYAGVVHDYLYYNNGEIALPPRYLSRKECDQIFLHILDSCRPHGLWRHYFTVFNRAMYLAVRIFGWMYWR